MSKILPIKSTLDEKYINETETITEPALEALISGGGSGGEIEIVRFSYMYDEAAGRFVYSADKTFDELTQAIRDGKTIIGFDPGYESAPDRYGIAAPLSCAAYFDTKRFVFTGLVGDNSSWPRLSAETLVLLENNIILREIHPLLSEIVLLGVGGAQLTGSPYILGNDQRSFGLALGGQKSGDYYNDGTTINYGVRWAVRRLDNSSSVNFNIVDSDAFESGKVLEIDLSSASSHTPVQAIITAEFTDAMGIRSTASMLVTADYVAPK